MPDLKPCPFCGGEPTIYDIEPHMHAFCGMPDHAGSTVIECGCGCGLIDESRETVTERWNTRADSAAVAAEREACSKAVRAVRYSIGGSGTKESAMCVALDYAEQAIRARAIAKAPEKEGRP